MLRRTSGIAAIFTLAACAVEPSTQAAPLVNGTASSDAAVLAVIHTRPDGTRQLCTGTLVAPAVVLTAKHCVFEDMGGAAWTAIPASDLAVSLGDSVSGATGSIEVASITTTAGPYHDGDGAIGGDLALLTLVTAAAGLTPHVVTTDAPASGEALRIAGFGYTATGSMGTLGERNEGTAAIVSVAAGTFTSEGASWTCTGDSGGPAFRASDGALIGVTSIGPRGCPASASIYTRLDVNAALLEAAGVPIASDVDAAVVGADATAPDAGTMTPRRAGGCGCRAGATRQGSSLLVALALMALATARRRTRTAG